MTTPESRWARSDHDQWDIITSVGYTALLVAGWRALHAMDRQPLVRDEYAQYFILASGDPYLTGLLAHPMTSENATAFPRLYGVQTRFFDEFFRAAAEAGLRCRAYRLAWPGETVVFELDQPKVLEFKARVLADRGAQPAAHRKEVAADLRADWPAALTTAGFDPQKPTAWSVEGVLPYLTAAAQNTLFARIDRLSAPGSRLAVGALGSFQDWDRFAALEAAFPGVNTWGEVDFSALTYDRETKTSPAQWLADHGWAVDPIRTNPELQASYGRSPAEVDIRIDAIMHSQYITATR
jgi:methyltransferase (TIGR00027 family)